MHKKVIISPYQICTRCIMDTSDPDIRFDDKGLCNHCTQFEERVINEVHYDKPELLENLIHLIKEKGKSNEYDCLIGLSGGLDSTTLALKAVDLGLRPLAVHLDNGWDSEIAVDNIRKTIQALRIDFLTHVIDWEEFRDIQLSFIRSGVPNCEIPTDHAINALMWNTAAKYKIKFVLNGSNLVTEGILPIAWTYSSYDLYHMRRIHQKFSNTRISTFPTLSLVRFFSYIFFRKMRMVNLLNYIPYNRTQAAVEIETRLGWRPYGHKHYESVWTRFYQGYYLPKKFGFDKRRAHLSTLIMSRQITREKALVEMERNLYSDELLQQDMQYILKKFGFTRDEFDRIMRMPNKMHYDYPNLNLIHYGLKGAVAWFKRNAMHVE